MIHGCLVVASACGPAAAAEPAPTRAPVPAPTRASVPAPTHLPWAIRFSRACSVWESSSLAVTQAHVFSCGHSIYDASSAALVDVQRARLRPLGSAGALSLWELSEPDAAARLVVRDEALRMHSVDLAGGRHTRPCAAGWIELDDGRGTCARAELRQGMSAPDGRSVLVWSDTQLLRVDLVSRRVLSLPHGDACAGAIGVGFDADGQVQCMVSASSGETLLRTLGAEEARDRALGAHYYHARWSPRGDAILAQRTGALVFLDAEGAPAAERELSQSDHGEEGVLDVSLTGAALVTGRGATELWTLEGGAIRVQPVFAGLATRGAFVGESVVLELSSRATVWLHRGAPRALSSAPVPSAPPGFTALLPDQEGDAPTFEGDGDTLNRDLGDVAAFSGESAHVVVSRSDASELARFADDDAAWARMVAARYVERGSDRWAYFHRDAAGRRVVVGHSYIGGCERTHTDVRVTELDGQTLERWRVYSGERDGIDSILGAHPSDAVEILSARSDTYEGDPSIGSL